MPLYSLQQYNSPNSAYARDISFMNKEITDIPITKQYIVYGALFAIISSILTYFIAGLIFYLVFQSINSIQHEKLNERIKYLMTVVYKSKEKLSSLKVKLQRAIWKIRGLTAWRLVLADIKNGITTKKPENNEFIIDNIANSEESNNYQIKEDSIEHKIVLPNTNDVDISARSNNSKISLFNKSTLFERNKLIESNLNNTSDKIEQIALTLEFNDNKIEVNDNFEYKGGKSTGSNRSKIYYNNLAKYYCYEVYSRQFLFPSLVNLKKYEKIESNSLTICEKEFYSFEEKVSTKLLYCFRVFMIFAIFCYIWYQIAVFLTGIYISYGNKFYYMSIFPACAMVLINFGIITNIMLFLSTVCMHLCGFTVYKQEGLSALKVLFMLFIPSQALYLHESIINFRDLHIKFLKTNKKL